MNDDRESLIADKQEVIRKLNRAQRKLEAIGDASGPFQRRQRGRLEREVERLMSEEYRLRNAIDRAKQR
jgi:phage FluMu protein gp41